MFFDVPIIAYDAAAISDTLGGCGVLLDDNSPEFAAAVIDRVVHDKALREYIIDGQRKRLEDFSYDRIRSIFEHHIRWFIDKK
jgi:glycosyltransferase involved in cell wall biosynthesis